MFFCSLSFFFFFAFVSFCVSTCFFCAHHEDRNQAPIATAVCTHGKHSRTPSNRPRAEQQKTVGSCRPESDNASTQTIKSKSQVLPRATMYERAFYVSFCPLCCCFCFVKDDNNSFGFFPSTADSQPCDEPPSRLYSEYYFWSGISVTGVTKNSGLFAVTSTTCSTLLLAVRKTVFFHPSTSSTPSVRADSSSY